MKTIQIQISGYEIKTLVVNDNESFSESDFARAILAKLEEAICDLQTAHYTPPQNNKVSHGHGEDGATTPPKT